MTRLSAVLILRREYVHFLYVGIDVAKDSLSAQITTQTIGACGAMGAF